MAQTSPRPQSRSDPVKDRPPQLDDLIVCAACDALYRAVEPPSGGRVMCMRCHHVLIRPRAGAVLQIVALGLAVLVLLVGALFLPFLEIRVRGLSNSSSIFDAALAFTGPELIWLSLGATALIIGVPLARVLLITWSLGPILLRRRLLPGARTAFRWAENMRPWSMAEIFILGVGVALVKVVDLARVEIGPAFWMFTLLVIITLLQDTYMCRWTIWKELDEADARAGAS